MKNRNLTTKKIVIKGRVQGVGFRPFVYKTAHKYSFNGYKYNLNGYVLNDSNGVEIVVRRKFHNGLIHSLISIALKLSKDTRQKNIALSGEIFQNKTLMYKGVFQLKQAGLIPITNIRMHPNDENLSLGQVFYVANKIL